MLIRKKILDNIPIAEQSKYPDAIIFYGYEFVACFPAKIRIAFFGRPNVVIAIGVSMTINIIQLCYEFI